MMGPEPYRAALDAGAQVILAGRSTDPAPWAALAMHHGMPPAQAWFAGKMLECACNAALPKKHDCLMGTVAPDYVEVEPLNPELRCTPLSVAVQALHENASPIIHKEPGGLLDTSACEIKAHTERAVRVSGMQVDGRSPTRSSSKAPRKSATARSLSPARAIPGLIGQIDDFAARGARIRGDQSRGLQRLARGLSARAAPLRQERRDGRVGAAQGRERRTRSASSPEAVAKTQDIANAVVSVTRVTLLHTDFPGAHVQGRQHGVSVLAFRHRARRGLRILAAPRGRARRSLQMFPIEYENV